MICGKLKNLDFSRINPSSLQSIKNNVLCLFPYLSNHLVIGPNFSFSHRSQSQGYKGGSQKFSPISLYTSRYVTCGKWKIDFSRIYSSPLLSCWNHLLTHSLVLSSHFPRNGVGSKFSSSPFTIFHFPTGRVRLTLKEQSLLKWFGKCCWCLWMKCLGWG